MTEEELLRLSDEGLLRLVGLIHATPDEPPLVTARRHLAAFDCARRRAEPLP